MKRQFSLCMHVHEPSHREPPCAPTFGTVAGIFLESNPCEPNACDAQ